MQFLRLIFCFIFFAGCKSNNETSKTYRVSSAESSLVLDFGSAFPLLEKQVEPSYVKNRSDNPLVLKCSKINSESSSVSREKTLSKPILSKQPTSTIGVLENYPKVTQFSDETFPSHSWYAGLTNPFRSTELSKINPVGYLNQKGSGTCSQLNIPSYGRNPFDLFQNPLIPTSSKITAIGFSQSPASSSQVVSTSQQSTFSKSISTNAKTPCLPCTTSCGMNICDPATEALGNCLSAIGSAQHQITSSTTTSSNSPNLFSSYGQSSSSLIGLQPSCSKSQEELERLKLTAVQAFAHIFSLNQLHSNISDSDLAALYQIYSQASPPAVTSASKSASSPSAKAIPSSSRRSDQTGITSSIAPAHGGSSKSPNDKFIPNSTAISSAYPWLTTLSSSTSESKAESRPDVFSKTNSPAASNQPRREKPKHNKHRDIEPSRTASQPKKRQTSSAASQKEHSHQVPSQGFQFETSPISRKLDHHFHLDQKDRKVQQKEAKAHLRRAESCTPTSQVQKDLYDRTEQNIYIQSLYQQLELLQRQQQQQQQQHQQQKLKSSSQCKGVPDITTSAAMINPSALSASQQQAFLQWANSPLGLAQLSLSSPSFPSSSATSSELLEQPPTTCAPGPSSLGLKKEIYSDVAKKERHHSSSGESWWHLLLH